MKISCSNNQTHWYFLEDFCWIRIYLGEETSEPSYRWECQAYFSLPLGTALLLPRLINHNHMSETHTIQPMRFVTVKHTSITFHPTALSSLAFLLFPVKFFVPMRHSTRRIVHHSPIFTLGQDSNFSPTKFLAAWDVSGSSPLNLHSSSITLKRWFQPEEGYITANAASTLQWLKGYYRGNRK